MKTTRINSLQSKQQIRQSNESTSIFCLSQFTQVGILLSHNLQAKTLIFMEQKLFHQIGLSPTINLVYR